MFLYFANWFPIIVIYFNTRIFIESISLSTHKDAVYYTVALWVIIVSGIQKCSISDEGTQNNLWIESFMDWTTVGQKLVFKAQFLVFQ